MTLRSRTSRSSAFAASALLVVLAAGCSNSTTRASRAGAEKAPPINDPQSAETVAASVDRAPTLPPDPFDSSTGAAYWRSGQSSGADFPTTYAGVVGAGEQTAAPSKPLPGEIPAPELPEMTKSTRSDGVENLRQVTFANEGADFDPVISRDGSTVFFASTAHSATSDIFSKSVDGRTLTQLTTDPANDAMPAVSPDGARIAFASNRGGNWDIYVMSSTGGQAIQITGDSAQELHPAWSHDGRTLAYCRLSDTSGRWEIWITDVEKPAVKRFLTQGLFPDWHPSEHRLLFQRSRERGDRYFSIWTIDLVEGDATSPTLIASSATAAIVNPRWSQDGQYIACATVSAPPQGAPVGRPEKSDIWIMKPDGSGRANLTGGRNVNLMPAWGPDNVVFFVTDRSGSDNIWSTSSNQAMFAAGASTASLPVVTRSNDFPGSRNVSGAGEGSLPKPTLPKWMAGATPNPAPQKTDSDLPPEMANVPTDMSEDHR